MPLFSIPYPFLLPPLVKLLTTVAPLLLKIRSGVFSTWHFGILGTAEVSLDTVALMVNFLWPRCHSSHSAISPAPSDGLAMLSDVWGDVVTSADAVGDALVRTGKDILVFVSVASGTDCAPNSDRAAAAKATDVFAFEKFGAGWSGFDGK